MVTGACSFSPSVFFLPLVFFFCFFYEIYFAVTNNKVAVKIMS